MSLSVNVWKKSVMATYHFANKVILITGGSAGIGEATAKQFAKLGASIALTGRDQKNLEQVARDCKSLGARDVLAILAEFSKQEDINKTMDETIKKFSKLDVLINNVGAVRDGNLANVTMGDFDFLFNINVKSALYMTQLAMPYLLQTKGNVVNVSSLSAIGQYPNALIYGMSKASLDQFTKTIALEYAPKGVRVNSVNPACVRTKICRNRGFSDEQTKKFYESADGSHPLGRCGDADEIANAIVFLASDLSGWTTGQCLVLDGGKSVASR